MGSLEAEAAERFLVAFGVSGSSGTSLDFLRARWPVLELVASRTFATFLRTSLVSLREGTKEHFVVARGRCLRVWV